MALEVLPLAAEKKSGSFDLFTELLTAVTKNHISLVDGDIIVISSKYISNSEGRILESKNIIVSEEGKSLSEKFHMNPKLAEMIIRESDYIFGGISGFVITSLDNIMAPNAGIDKSNAGAGRLILYPANPYQTAEELKRKIFLKFSIHVGIIIVDSRLMPSRIGTTGVSIACSGFEPVKDMRAKKDLDGRPLKVTFQATADNIASIANYVMGEGGESRPFAVIKNSGVSMTDRKIKFNEMAISPDQCVYVRGLRSGNL